MSEKAMPMPEGKKMFNRFEHIENVSIKIFIGADGFPEPEPNNENNPNALIGFIDAVGPYVFERLAPILLEKLIPYLESIIDDDDDDDEGADTPSSNSEKQDPKVKNDPDKEA